MPRGRRCSIRVGSVETGKAEAASMVFDLKGVARGRGEPSTNDLEGVDPVAADPGGVARPAATHQEGGRWRQTMARRVLGRVARAGGWRRRTKVGGIRSGGGPSRVMVWIGRGREKTRVWLIPCWNKYIGLGLGLHHTQGPMSQHLWLTGWSTPVRLATSHPTLVTSPPCCSKPPF
jgi:hypothetical protein